VALRARYSKIDGMVELLLVQYRQDVPPVRIEKIVRGLGLEVRAGDLNDVSGLLVRTGDTAIIGVNSTQARVRQRFTIAHELGHFLLHEGIQHHVDHTYRVNFRSEVSSSATSVDEIEANFFAASLLMPKKFLDAANAVEAIEDDEKVSALAKQFDVSRHAMSLRLVNVYEQYSPY
jgi:Zn-dependent peptidase ImmA (M78 family)